MEPIDIDKAVEYLGGKGAFLATAGSFLAECDGMLECLNSAVESADADAVGEKAHCFKGGLAFLHAAPSVEAARHLQDVANKKPSEVPTAFALLVKEVDRLKRVLERCLSGENSL